MQTSASVSVVQELPKYLRGYHSSSREETTDMAALLLRIKAGNGQPQAASIPRVLKELVPVDQLKAMSENEWKKVLGTTSLKKLPYYWHYCELVELKCALFLKRR